MVTAVDVHAHVRETNKLLCDAFRRGAPEEIAALYTPEGEIMPPGDEFARGHEAIEDFWHTARDKGIRDLDLYSLELETLGDTAFEVGRYTIYGEGRRKMDEGKYLVVWKEDHGMWKLHRDIWNSNGM